MNTFSFSSASEKSERWYHPKQVQLGQSVFEKHCMACHGKNAAGITSDWRQAYHLYRSGNYIVRMIEIF